MTRTQRHAIHVILIVLIILTTLFILGEKSFDTINTAVNNLPLQSQAAAVSDFDGNIVGQYLPNTTGILSIGDTVNLGGMSAITISLWVKADSIGSFSILSKRHSASPWYSFNISIDTQSGNRTGCGIINAAGTIGTAGGGSGTLTTSSWHHIVCVYDGSTVSVYTDGAKSGFSANLTNTVFDSDGNLTVPFSTSFAGSIGDIRIYNTALSDSKIGELYALGAPQGSTSTTPSADTSPPTTTTPPTPPPTTPPATSPTTSGSIISAASCSQQDVQAAINTATDGQMVYIPAGTCTWTFSTDISCANSTASACVPISIPSKSLIIRGAGEGQTNIITQMGNSNWNKQAMVIQTVSGKPVRLTGMTFTASTGAAVIAINGNSKNVRMDHLSFNLSGEGKGEVRGIFLNGSLNGVVDHVTFNITGHNQGVFFRNDNNAAWKRPGSIGGSDAVFIEDSHVNRDMDPAHNAGAFDGDSGARFVFRYNDVTNSTVFYHGPEVAGTRGGMSLEIYKNTFRNQGYQMFDEVSFWSGTGVVWGNTMTGSIALPIMVQNRRSCIAYQVFGQCTGNNPYDGNTDSSGYPCLDQVGRSTDASSNAYHPQTYEPIYQWNNTYNGNPVNITITHSFDQSYPTCRMIDHIKKDRDFFDNTPRPGYVPYAYPHPLTTSGFTSDDPNSPFVAPPVQSSPLNSVDPAQTPQSSSTADFNHDGAVNTLDFSLMVSAWNTTSSIYDLNHDTTVNTLDYSIMAGQWTR